ncbi:MAG: TerB family tellurite resistance protein [Bacteroidales bacterium]|nr:TerB family tellurite resistance protein [Bacteroidales bacterium]
MAKYGKWIGGGLGWAFGGPIGAILGFVFGSMYDSMQSGEFALPGSEGHPYGQQEGRAQTQTGDFSASLLVLSAAIMKADERVMRSELDYVKQFLVRQFGEEQAKEQIMMLREILKQEINVYEVSLQIRNYMDYSSRLQLLHFLFGIALADGKTQPSEVDIIQMISKYIGVRNSDFNSIKAMFVRDTTSAYKILETTPDASDEEIKKAYRRMATKYHPDKVSHLGDDIQKAAKEKFQNVSEAYNKIKEERGIK